MKRGERRGLVTPTNKPGNVKMKPLRIPKTRHNNKELRPDANENPTIFQENEKMDRYNSEAREKNQKSEKEVSEPVNRPDVGSKKRLFTIP